METKFNSQICTSIEQSERLLKLGLKSETADMGWVSCVGGEWGIVDRSRYYADIPAWSLHKLIVMRLAHDPFAMFQVNSNEDAYEKIISHIEHMIKEGYFPKEYLN